MRRMMMLAVLAAIGGCGHAPDDPLNPPVAGLWQKSIRMIAFTIDDNAIDRKTAPFAIPPDLNKTICGEPVLRTREAAEREINKLGTLHCTLDSLDAEGSSITGGGICTIKSDGPMKIAGKIDLSIEQGADAIDGKQVFDVYVHLPSGQTEQAHIVHKIEWKRLGECR